MLQPPPGARAIFFSIPRRNLAASLSSPAAWQRVHGIPGETAKVAEFLFLSSSKLEGIANRNVAEFFFDSMFEELPPSPQAHLGSVRIVGGPLGCKTERVL